MNGFTKIEYTDKENVLRYVAVKANSPGSEEYASEFHSIRNVFSSFCFSIFSMLLEGSCCTLICKKGENLEILRTRIMMKYSLFKRTSSKFKTIRLKSRISKADAKIYLWYYDTDLKKNLFRDAFEYRLQPVIKIKGIPASVESVKFVDFVPPIEYMPRKSKDEFLGKTSSRIIETERGDLGYLLYTCRIESKLSIDDVCHLVGTTRYYYKALETGKGDIDHDVLARVCKLFKLNQYYVFSLVKKVPPAMLSVICAEIRKYYENPRSTKPVPTFNMIFDVKQEKKELAF